MRYARDAFEGLRLMDAFMAVKRGEPGAELPALRARRVARRDGAELGREVEVPARSDVAADNEVPTPPFWGSRVVKGIPLADYAAYLDERALFLGQWGLKSSRGDGPDYQALVEIEGRPRLRMWLDRMHTEGLLGAAVVYGYFPCWSEGDELVVLDPTGLAEAGRSRWITAGSPQLHRLKFPRQRRDRHLCLADFFRSQEAVHREGEPDVVAFHVVTMGSPCLAGRGQALRGQRLPGVRRAARPGRPAHRGPRRVLARAGPLRAGHRRARTPPTGPSW